MQVEDIISRYKYHIYPNKKTFLFEIRTSFILKTIDGVDHMLDSETFDAEVKNNAAQFKEVFTYGVVRVDLLIGDRLSDLRWSVSLLPR